VQRSGVAGTGGTAVTDSGAPDSTPDAAPTDRAVVATHPACKDIDQTSKAIVAAKGCTNTDISKTIARCEDVYTNRTQCTAPADKFAACVKAAAQSTWASDTSGSPTLTGTTCQVEQDAVKACAGFASPTGQGCATDSTNACQKRAATKCCTEALACASNVECVAIYECTSGPWMTKGGGREARRRRVHRRLRYGLLRRPPDRADRVRELFLRRSRHRHVVPEHELRDRVQVTH
jgi:hypothetical protein